MAELTWPLDYGPCDDCEAITELDAPGSPTTPKRDLVESVAIGLLWRWTGRVFGTEQVAVDLDPTTATTWTTYRNRGGYPNALLLSYRWSAVSAVAIDGVPVTSFLLDGRILTWDAPGGCAQRITVTGTMGIPTPPGGQVAAAQLACELAKAMCGDSSCALPERVQSVSRQGITMTILDQFEDLDEGKTGIWLIDAWVASVMRSPMPATVGSPDSHRMTRLRYGR